eukprot:67190-Prymnesium_polylepis.1
MRCVSQPLACATQKHKKGKKAATAAHGPTAGGSADSSSEPSAIGHSSAFVCALAPMQASAFTSPLPHSLFGDKECPPRRQQMDLPAQRRCVPPG